MTSAALRRDEDEAPVVATARAALYLRVSTGRQAESDLSIPDQRRQIEGYCLSRGWEVAAEFVEPGNPATADRGPACQARSDAAMQEPSPFNVLLVQRFSRFFGDHFQFEVSCRKLTTQGVGLISINKDLGDDPLTRSDTRYVGT